MVNMLRILMEKVDNMQEQINNISRDMEMKNTFDGLTTRLDTTEE